MSKGERVSQNQGVAVIGHDLVVLGDIKDCRLVEIYGRVQGSIDSEHVRVHPGGIVRGPLRAGSAEINGDMEGEVTVTSLIAIGSQGRVSGRVRYGQLALAEGGELSAEVRNIPPQVSGDYQIAVRQGRSVRITTADITAVDPDDTAKSLTFTVSSPVNGYVAMVDAPGAPVARFSQADLEADRVLFVHRGGDASPAGFDVTVTDKAGESSGAPKTVKAAVIAAG